MRQARPANIFTPVRAGILSSYDPDRCCCDLLVSISLADSEGLYSPDRPASPLISHITIINSKMGFAALTAL